MDDKGIVAVDARIRVDFAKPSTDPYHHLAIHPYPSQLMRNLMEVARDRELERMQGQVPAINFRMLELVRTLNFQVLSDPDDGDSSR
jgi:hypothetical protein